MTSPFANAIRRTWLQREIYGWKHAPALDQCNAPFLYAKMLLSASGAAAPHHREYVLGMIHTHYGAAADGELIDYVNHFTPPPFLEVKYNVQHEATTGSGDDSVQSILSFGENPTPHDKADCTKLRVLMYDALSASRSLTTAAVHRRPGVVTDSEAKVAKALGLSTSTAQRIAHVCDRESALVARRRRLLLADDDESVVDSR